MNTPVEDYDLESLFGWMRKNPSWSREIQAIDSLQAEIERLRKAEATAIKMLNNSTTLCRERFAEYRAEIKRLRENECGWLAANSPGGWIDDLRNSIEWLSKEIEALRHTPQANEIERLRNALEISCGARELANQEIERLKDDLQRATSMPMATEAARNVALEKKVDQQKAEIERLRGLLRVCMRRWIPFKEVYFRRTVMEAAQCNENGDEP